MLYLFVGEGKEARVRADGLMKKFVSANPDGPLSMLDEETFFSENLPALIGGQGLFDSKSFVLFQRILENKDAKDDVISKIKEFEDSPNIFVFCESALDKATISKFEKGGDVEVFESEKKTGRKFDIFSLTDALGRRNRKDLWVLLEKAKRADVSPEEIHGILFWQIKSMMLALKSAGAADAGLKPFVYGKSKGFLRNYKPEEVEKISRDLVVMYHDARRGAHDFGNALERWALSI